MNRHLFMPQKVAKSKDPEQQKLRDAKKGWNLAAREFIKRFIGFKQGINGRGNPTYSLPPSDIKEPIPSEVQSFESELASNFAQLMSAVARIEADQAAYSARKQKQMAEREQRKAKAPTEPKPAEPMAKPASIRSIIKKASTMATGRLLINEREFDTLLAITADEQERGLMYRAPPTPVMTFVYDRPQMNAFWMKSTPAPLDIVFALHGRITGIKKGEPYSTQTITTYSPSDLVIELPEGTCKQLGISEGNTVKLIH